MSLTVKHFYRFGDFTVDTDQKVLLCRGKPLPLTPKVFATLLILIENSGRIVEKEAMMNRLWPNTFVEEANLGFNIQQLRKALGDDARHPRFIETVSRRGYRFIASVEESLDKPANNPDKTEQPWTLRIGHTVFRTTVQRPLLATFAVVFVMGVVGWVLLLYHRSSVRAAPDKGRQMLAVLPFQNLTGDTTQDYFSDGLTEEMITQLANLDPN